MTTLPFLSARVTQPVSLSTRQAGRPAPSATASMRLLPPTGVAHRCVIDVSLRCATRVARNMAAPASRGDEQTALDAARYSVTDLDKEVSNARPLRRGDNQVVRGEIPNRGIAPSDCSGSIVEAFASLPCMTRTSPQMSSQGRLSAEVVEHAETVVDFWARARKDNVIDLNEQRELTHMLHVLERKAADVDEGLAIVVAMTRRGPESPRVQRLMRERDNRLRLVVRNDFPDDGPRAA